MKPLDREEQQRCRWGELRERATWVFEKYVDAEGVRQCVEPMNADSAVASEIRADKLRTRHP